MHEQSEKLYQMHNSCGDYGQRHNSATDHNKFFVVRYNEFGLQSHRIGICT